jgi:hypothetical protein
MKVSPKQKRISRPLIPGSIGRRTPRESQPMMRITAPFVARRWLIRSRMPMGVERNARLELVEASAESSQTNAAGSDRRQSVDGADQYHA